MVISFFSVQSSLLQAKEKIQVLFFFHHDVTLFYFLLNLAHKIFFLQTDDIVFDIIIAFFGAIKPSKDRIYMLTQTLIRFKFETKLLTWVINIISYPFYLGQALFEFKNVLLSILSYLGVTNMKIQVIIFIFANTTHNDDNFEEIPVFWIAFVFFLWPKMIELFLRDF